jgi:hypothetical protein
MRCTHRQREDRQRLAQLVLGEAHDARARHLHRAGDRLRALGAGTAAVEDDERVLLVERDARAVQELLGRQALRRHVRRLADLQRALLRRPRVGAGADQLDQARGGLDHRPGRGEHARHGVGHGRELAEVRAEGASDLRQPQQRARVARGVRV